MATRFPKQLVLQSTPGAEGIDYFPQPAHNATTAAARQQDEHGTLLAEKQYIGAMTTSIFIEKYSDALPEAEVPFAHGLAAAAAFQTAQYSLPNNGTVMFRRITIPRLFNAETGRPLTPKERLAKTSAALGLMVKRSGAVYEHMKNSELREAVESSRLLGYEAAVAAIWIALHAHPEIGHSSSVVLTQRAVFGVGKAAMDAIPEINKKLGGTKVTFAMLAEKNNVLTSYLHSTTQYDGTLHALKAARKAATKTFKAQADLGLN